MISFTMFAFAAKQFLNDYITLPFNVREITRVAFENHILVILRCYTIWIGDDVKENSCNYMEVSVTSCFLFYFFMCIILCSFHLSCVYCTSLGPWSYGSWICNYLCNQCLSPLMLWVRISIRAKCSHLCDKVCRWLATIKLTATI